MESANFKKPDIRLAYLACFVRSQMVIDYMWDGRIIAGNPILMRQIAMKRLSAIC